MGLVDDRVQLRGKFQIDCHDWSFVRSWMTPLDDYDARGDADRAQVAVPAFDGMFLGEAVAAEQLYAVQADLHALVGAEPFGQRRLAGERQTLLGARGAAPGDQSQAVKFDGDVGGHEG